MENFDVLPNELIAPTSTCCIIGQNKRSVFRTYADRLNLSWKRIFLKKGPFIQLKR